MYKKSRLKVFFGLVVPVILLGGMLVWGVLALLTPASMTFVTYAAPEIGIAIDDNLTIVHVLEGSAAEKAGLQSGDILKKIGDQQVISASTAKTIRREEIAAVTKLVPAKNNTQTQEIGDLILTLERNKLEIKVTLKPTRPGFYTSEKDRNTIKPTPTPAPAPSNLIYL